MDSYSVIVVATMVTLVVVTLLGIRKINMLTEDQKHQEYQIHRLKKENTKLQKITKIKEQPVVVPVKEKEVEYIRKIRYVRIDSRDKSVKMQNNKFIYTLDQKISNVESIELYKFTSAKGMYIVDDHNKKMYIHNENTGQIYPLEVQKGIYGITSYITALNNVFTSNGLPLTISFQLVNHSTVLANTSSTDSYGVIYNVDEYEDTNFNLIGFDPEDFVLEPQTTKNSPNRVNLFGSNMITISFDNVSFGYGDNTLASILVDESAITSYERDCLNSKRIISPTISLSKLIISTSFKPRGKSVIPYKFNGIEFSMVLEITTKERKITFSDTFSDTLEKSRTCT